MDAVTIRPATDMSIRTALIIAAVIILAMFVFDRAMIANMNGWASQTVEISLTQRVLAGMAVLWNHFWWALTPMIVGFMLTVSVLSRPAKRA